MRDHLAKLLISKYGSGPRWDDLPELGRDLWRQDADAILAELREPTPEMVGAGLNILRRGVGNMTAEQAKAVYQAAIAAASKATSDGD